MVATNIAYHINDTDKSYPATLKTTSRHNSLRGLRHCKHQVLLHVNLASETLYSVSRRYRYPEIYIYQTSNAGGGHDKTGDWPKDEQIPKVRAKSLPACCNPRLSFDLRFLWTVEVDGCLCSCRIVVFSPTAPIIADLFCNGWIHHWGSDDVKQIVEICRQMLALVAIEICCSTTLYEIEKNC